ncbi:hypothetical protein HN51_069580 [Arachis hypogaea]
MDEGLNGLAIPHVGLNPENFESELSIFPEKDGLFCERIFGPVKSGICACGNYRVIGEKKKDNQKFCEQCGVEFVDSRIRRYQMGYIKLACPAHFVWAFSLMFLFSGRGYWQELIESIVWAHNKLKVAPATQPRALSIVQGRAVGVTHYLLGGIATTWAFFLARIIAVG